MGMSDCVRSLRATVGHDLLFGPATACLIRDDVGRLLLVQHVEGPWTFPAGAIEPGETPAGSARREAREEASIEVDILGIAGVYGGLDFHRTYANGDEVAWVSTLFEARILSGVPAPGDDETADVRRVTLDEAFALDVSSPTRHMLEGIRDGRRFD